MPTDTPGATDAPDPTDNPGADHLLLTVLGLDPKPARYSLGGAEVDADLAPCALLELLPPEDRPARVVALCTSMSETKILPRLRAAVEPRYEVTSVGVSDFERGRDQRAYLDEFLAEVVGAIPAGSPTELTLDITHGFRHFAFLTFVAALYLGALRGVHIRGAYYGLRQAGQDVEPFLDVRPLLELPRWVHAATVLGETGSARPISEILAELDDDQNASRVSNALRRVSESYLSGLPLELGRAVHDAVAQRRALGRLLRNRHRLPLADELVARISETVQPYELSNALTQGNWKDGVGLTREELSRQARLVGDLWQRGSHAVSLGLMREWMVSWAQWRLGATDSWLDEPSRRRAEATLHAFTTIASRPELDPMLSEAHRDLGCFWRQVRSLRNAYHHHGMRPQDVRADRPDLRGMLDRVWSTWQSTFRECPELSLDLPGSYGGALLVSPVGTRPGVLFSAVEAVRRAGYGDPSRCLVVCSAETESHIADALQRASFAGPWDKVCLADPHGGVDEVDESVEQAATTLVGADQVLVNLTGGTTLMGIAVSRMADEARTFARPIRRFGLIDRRASGQQAADPYQLGEPYWLDAEAQHATLD